MQMGSSNIPTKFRASSHETLPLPRRRPDKMAVRAFPGPRRGEATTVRTGSGVTIVRQDPATVAAALLPKPDPSIVSALSAPTPADREASLSLVLDLMGEDAEKDPEVR